MNFFSRKKIINTISWQHGLSHFLYSLLAWQSVHHQGSRSLARKQYFSLFTVSKSALYAQNSIPKCLARITCALHTSAKRMFSVWLAYWFELSLLKTNTQNNTAGTVTRLSPFSWSTASFTVNPGHAWSIFLKFERSFEIYMSVLKIANEISEFPYNFP